MQPFFISLCPYIILTILPSARRRQLFRPSLTRGVSHHRGPLCIADTVSSSGLLSALGHGVVDNMSGRVPASLFCLCMLCSSLTTCIAMEMGLGAVAVQQCPGKPMSVGSITKICCVCRCAASPCVDKKSQASRMHLPFHSHSQCMGCYYSRCIACTAGLWYLFSGCHFFTCPLKSTCLVAWRSSFLWFICPHSSPSPPLAHQFVAGVLA